MAINVVLPQWGMGMREGVVVEWLKAEGDEVREDEPVVEVESEKTTDTVYAPASGVLARILVPAGATARIYDTLAVIADPGEQVPDSTSAPEAVGAAGTTVDAPGPVASSAAPAPADAMEKVQVEPRARRLAHERGVSLAGVRGTGPQGRITEEDVARAAGSI